MRHVPIALELQRSFRTDGLRTAQLVRKALAAALQSFIEIESRSVLCEGYQQVHSAKMPTARNVALLMNGSWF